jgi:superfamily II DNA or RNA helicase
MLNEQKDKIQQEAIKAWINKGKIGTCEIITGLGKTFISLHALYTMPKDNKIHLFLAETVGRKKDLIDDIKKYNIIFKKNVTEDYNLQFLCYQSAYKLKDKSYGLVIADEIHDSLSPAYLQFYKNNKYDALIGLSATVNKNVKYIIGDKIVNKGELLESIAPICFKYSIDQGQEDGTARSLKVYVILHELDNITKNIVAGSKTKKFLQTEKSAYDYWDKIHKQAWYILDEETKQLKIRISAHKRSNILYNLESKVVVVKKLLLHLKSKTIVFGNSIESLLKITPNVVSSKNTEISNERIRHSFDEGKINVIGSFKKLKQGANLKGLDNCIIMSYYSTDKDFIQRIGRLRNDGTIGLVFILLTKETQEELWFSKMTEKVKTLNPIYFNNIDDCLLALKIK